MSLFDNVICEYPLPDGWEHMQHYTFQTHSLNDRGDIYRIGADGMLYVRELYWLSDEERADPALPRGALVSHRPETLAPIDRVFDFCTFEIEGDYESGLIYFVAAFEGATLKRLAYFGRE